MKARRIAIILASATALGAALGAASLAVIPARGQEGGSEQHEVFPCGPIARATEVASAMGGRPFVALTPDQWQFMRGLFLMAKDTPNSLPPGDHALISMREDGSASIVYVDGNLACSPMKLGPEGVAILMQVGRGEIVHSGSPSL